MQQHASKPPAIVLLDIMTAIPLAYAAAYMAWLQQQAPQIAEFWLRLGDKGK